MPRKSRIDFPGGLHHIIARGNERKEIFSDDIDYNRFLQRLGRILVETKTQCLAWALLPNHFHLLLRTGSIPISTVMRRLLTGHALYYNRRHLRNGHLFQNRYKSILCQEDAYLLELVRYIHLNPFRAGLVKRYNDLSAYPFCGHSAILKRTDRLWQDTDSVLALFGEERKNARIRYQSFVREGIDMGKRKDLMGGGMLRSPGGWTAVNKSHRNHPSQKGDERILGDGHFIDNTLRKAEARMERQLILTAQGIDFEEVVQRVANHFGLPPADLLAGGKRRQTVTARSLLCYWAATELGLSQVQLSHRLKISQPAISAAVERGRQLAKKEQLQLMG